MTSWADLILRIKLSWHEANSPYLVENREQPHNTPVSRRQSKGKNELNKKHQDLWFIIFLIHYLGETVCIHLTSIDFCRNDGGILLWAEKQNRVTGNPKYLSGILHLFFFYTPSHCFCRGIRKSWKEFFGWILLNIFFQLGNPQRNSLLLNDFFVRIVSVAWIALNSFGITNSSRCQIGYLISGNFTNQSVFWVRNRKILTLVCSISL